MARTRPLDEINPDLPDGGGATRDIANRIDLQGDGDDQAGDERNEVTKEAAPLSSDPHVAGHHDEAETRRRDAEDDGDGEDAGGMRPMRYTCEGCGTENEVLPPKGFMLARIGESPPWGCAAPRPVSTKGHAILVERLTRQLEAREPRFRHANAREQQLLRETIALRAEIDAGQLEREAACALGEARIPPNVLSVDDLITYHPSQWAWQIRFAETVLREQWRGTRALETPDRPTDRDTAPAATDRPSAAAEGEAR